MLNNLFWFTLGVIVSSPILLFILAIFYVGGRYDKHD